MTQRSTVLVTGGAGYIGSHTLLQLVARGERVVVLDDLSTGFRQAVQGADQVEILEVIDHHRIGTLTTHHPILFRNEPVGSIWRRALRHRPST